MAKQQCKKCNSKSRLVKMERFFFYDDDNIMRGRVKLICRECKMKHTAILGKHFSQDSDSFPNDVNWSTLKIIKEK